MKEDSPVIVSVHIEKTAGTTVEDIFVRHYGPRNVLIYNPDTDRLLPTGGLAGLRRTRFVNALRERIGGTAAYPVIQKLLIRYLRMHQSEAETQGINDSIRVIHGHFSADRFDRIVPHRQLVTVVREPLDRTLSHFKHWQRARGIMTHRVQIPFDPSLEFRDFAMLPEMINYQTTALCHKPHEDFFAVGTTDRLGVFVARVLRGQTRAEPIRHLNRSSQPLNSDVGIDEEFKRKYGRLNEEDVAFYRRAREMM